MLCKTVNCTISGRNLKNNIFIYIRIAVNRFFVKTLHMIDEYSKQSKSLFFYAKEETGILGNSTTLSSQIK